MSRIVIFRENSSTHEEEYLARADKNTFVSVENPGESNLDFETRREAYEFARSFESLQHWRVGVR
jgi:hypothetical protein